MHTPTYVMLPQVCRRGREHSYRIAIVRHHHHLEKLQLLLINQHGPDSSFSLPGWELPTGTSRCVSADRGTMDFAGLMDMHLLVTKYCKWVRLRIIRDHVDYIIVVANNGKYDTKLGKEKTTETLNLGSRWISLSEIPGLKMDRKSTKEMQKILRYAEWRVDRGNEKFWERWMFWRSDRRWQKPSTGFRIPRHTNERSISPDRWMVSSK